MTEQQNVVPFQSDKSVESSKSADKQKSAPAPQELGVLARLIERFAPHDGRFDLPVPGLHVLRQSSPSSELQHTLSKPGLCLVAQGTKCVYLADRRYEYNESRMAVYAAEVPLGVKFIEASKAEPYLCLVVHIDRKKLSELIFRAYPNGLPMTRHNEAIYLDEANPDIVRSAIRMLELILSQDNADLLAPLMIDEILIRLLRSPAGAAIAHIGLSDSHAFKVAEAITWIKEHFREPIKIDHLAELANMSSSSFHHHFKSVTKMTPLQFQKTMRLQEARQLLLTRAVDISTACHRVGYASVSQFSREYSRMFGRAPSKDIGHYRDH
ncbi:AraC family transcriptional regulator [Marinimicrobium sp. C6131]|uniref:AraC family transcriptional regulator n=1 Tax=Marinimicrobium sp. C6131 TaxID=3022676 RepID=UPI00223DF0C9|nr:AraC family transcriptional regulator [Marinimicrobium sp. C6131]UZJ43099.1 AraC family transcriptional regulator [Marinimicrobium sp. C6131]